MPRENVFFCVLQAHQMKRIAKIDTLGPKKKNYYKKIGEGFNRNDTFAFSDNIADWQTSKVNQRKIKGE